MIDRRSNAFAATRGWRALHAAWLLPRLGAATVMLAIALAIYLPGLGGGFLFDDYPNIVDNPMVQPRSTSLADLSAAALSSPSSELKRPLSSLSFAANFLVSGLDARSMKFTNLAIHLLNGWLLFLVARRLFVRGWRFPWIRAEKAAALLTLGWLTLPINVTAVLYVVQRMESLANLFVLLGLLGYLKGRERMLDGKGGYGAPLATMLLCTVVGVAAKETAVMLPLYALLTEVIVFRFARADAGGKDTRLMALHALIVGLPLAIGLAWLLPAVARTESWATRDFTLYTRLLSEARIVVDYIGWTVLPTPSALSFYHDDFMASSHWLQPPSTILSAIFLALLGACAWILRSRRPVAALGIAWYMGCHALTGTILPLELIYEHRNYFASIGILLVIADACSCLATALESRGRPASIALLPAVALLAWWCTQTASTAYDWGDSLRLAQSLAARGPESPRAQYELGRAYIIHSHYDVASPYTEQAYPPLERAASNPRSSILPEQALIFLNSRIGRPIESDWWRSIETKLRSRPASVQDESSLDALARCLADGGCRFPVAPLQRAFEASLEQPRPTGRLLAIYASFAQRSLLDSELALHLETRAVNANPTEPVYRISLARMAIDRGDIALAREQLAALATLNVGGRIDRDIASLRASMSRRGVAQ